jgi:hypothetical protein
LAVNLRSPFLLDELQPGAMLFFHLLRRMNSAAQVCDLHQFMLDGLQPFMPLAVNDLSSRPLQAFLSKLSIQLLNVSDLLSQTPNLVSKNP